ncbi:hypothetical protein Kpol_246p2 [Vanderwaltozyma polyspora DSM 70294]|uniref:Protein phosphatase PP2A regulatory subunit B n=1 Tax=Vanderwaltozyma polyspora (strain ATCC 22028 / DSM 70294 / BCRC 21397 / CBS 2163 / NBRC 10782 / NRRL Y-8283 / UCD 57-17) TaxID=436907 RepID=A7TT71_VANPO|nr:uncharacterized protein Kpol_246p2 [Vanderwaltozyma polyspora DSM 70294]EDO14533.1 hypothetical protein Kpol_246p2 [Vanderwaltozyma polyspora DSM 70294]
MSDENFDFIFSQCFGDKADIVVTEADIITSVEYDHTGDYLATGDKGGRVVLFERNHQSKNCEYKFLTEFQSHDAEFDYLKSLEIEEKINQIKWLKPTQKSHFLLTTNDKTIKLWKIYEKNIKLVSENNLSEDLSSSSSSFNNNNHNHNNNNSHLNNSASLASSSSALNSKNSNNQNSSSNINIGPAKAVLSLQTLKLPKLSDHDKIITAAPKRIYSNAHTYHIHSISVNSDQETFLSADDLRVNLWNLDIPDQSFNIVDIKPTNMEELTEVITSADFHPQHCNLFIYSSSKGTIRLCDMRQNAICDYQTKVFEEYIDPNSHNFFTEITSSISDVKFSPNGRYIASRDYLTVKIWDVNMDNKPLKTINIHEQLKERLSDTYENDAIFDKFEVEFSGDSSSIMTGSYNNNFMIYPNVINSNENDQTSIVKTFNENDVGSNSRNLSGKKKTNRNSTRSNDSDIVMENEDGIGEIVLQADKSTFKNKRIGSTAQRSARIKDWGDDIDFKKSILHFSWHPRENSIALAATNNLFIFSASKK